MCFDPIPLIELPDIEQASFEPPSGYISLIEDQTLEDIYLEDIAVFLDEEQIGVVSEIGYSIYSTQRERAPIYRMVDVDPLSFSRARRAIAGTITELTLSEHSDKMFLERLYFNTALEIGG